MMKGICKILLSGLAILFISVAVSSAQYDYIDIRNPSLKKIPIAIPHFRVSPGDSALSLQSSDQVAEYLDFTGFFKIMDRGMFLMDPTQPETDRATVKFQNWTTIGAELLVTGNILTQGDVVDMELRLFDPFKGEMLIGKRYKGWKKDMPQMLRRFCSEIIYLLTGSWGVFDSKIAFVSTATGHKEIFTCDFDGSRPPANHPFQVHHPVAGLGDEWKMDGLHLLCQRPARSLYSQPFGKPGNHSLEKRIEHDARLGPGPVQISRDPLFYRRSGHLPIDRRRENH